MILVLRSTTGPLVGASYADIHATLPAIRVTAALALLASGLVLVGGMRGQLARYGILAVGAGFCCMAEPKRQASGCNSLHYSTRDSRMSTTNWRYI